MKHLFKEEADDANITSTHLQGYELCIHCNQFVRFLKTLGFSLDYDKFDFKRETQTGRFEAFPAFLQECEAPWLLRWKLVRKAEGLKIKLGCERRC